MIWHLIAAIFSGLAAAGIALLLRTLSGKRLPRWVIPVFAALGMLGYQIHFEYSWFTYKQQQLPETTEIVSTEQGSALWRPWTYAFPMTIAFEVVDQENMKVTRSDSEEVIEFILYHFEKQYMDRVTHQTYLMNCQTQEMIPLDEESRQPRMSRLRQLDTNSPLYQAVCAA
ncbi:hypothetical protein R5M92_12205 [Halomonas sp. Bachu 37]|uniref:hypothetical protein n=1 Tax=Halomonas kashgarensis TaxID=3084920 RepID=UPI003217AABA